MVLICYGSHGLLPRPAADNQRSANGSPKRNLRRDSPTPQIMKVIPIKFSGLEIAMKPATKGVILSGLVYPGTGQMFLGRIYMGLGIITVSTIALIVLIYRMAIRIYRGIDPLFEMLVTKYMTFQNIKSMLNQTGYAGWDLELISLIVFIFCWVAAMVHAYYLGLNKDRRQKSESEAESLRKERPKG